MNTQPLVSVIVATYRRLASLNHALVSLAKQTYSNIEIVLVDDNADEQWNRDVREIVEAFLTCYPSMLLQYISNSENEGSAKSRNIGICAAHGQYVSFLDDDDVYLPQKIEEQLTAMLAGNADFSLTDLDLLDEKGTLRERRRRDYIQATDCASLIRYHLLYHMTGTDTLMFRSEYLIGIGGFNTADVGDEYYLMMRAIDARGVFCYAPYCSVKAYIHTGESSLSSGQKKIDGENRLFQYKKSFFHKLDKKSVAYIRMRHYAVLAFAEIRRGRYMAFGIDAIKSFLCAPSACIGLLRERRHRT